MAEGARDEVRYTAFLSYSHKDAAAAGRLHRRLESYRMPKRLAGTETARGTVPQRLAPIFRDREELPAAGDLSETVRTALAQSGALIILCSPNAAESPWVAEEIETFRKLHPDRPILAAILDGDPPDCFPAPLRAFGGDGSWHEPLATDLRRGKDGAHLGLLKLVAGITGVRLDELVQRDAARRIRRVTAVTAAALIAMLIMAALAVIAVRARAEAERQRAEAEGLIEFMLTDLRQKLKGVGRVEIMAAVNMRALQYYDRQPQFNGRPADMARRARVIQAAGEDELSGGDQASAEVRWRSVYRLTAGMLESAPDDPNFIFAHAQSEFWLGQVAYSRRDFRTARPYWERYKALADRLVAADPGNPFWLREAGYADGNVCSLDVRMDARAALRMCSSALARMEQVRGLQGDDPSLLVDLANRHAWMVGVLDASGRWDRALVHMALHEGIVRALIRRDPENFDYRDIWMASQVGFAQAYAQHGRRDQARQRLADAARTAALLRERDPQNAGWRAFEELIRDRMSALDRTRQPGG